MKLSCLPYVYYICNNTLPLAHEISRHFWAAYDLTFNHVFLLESIYYIFKIRAQISLKFQGIQSRHNRIKSRSHIDDYFAQKFIYFGQVEAYFQMFTKTRKLSENFPVCVRTCTACDFRNACCYEHAESMLYRIF